MLSRKRNSSHSKSAVFKMMDLPNCVGVAILSNQRKVEANGVLEERDKARAELVKCQEQLTALQGQLESRDTELQDLQARMKESEEEKEAVEAKIRDMNTMGGVMISLLVTLILILVF